MVQNNQALDISEQQLIDCSTQGQNDGCSKGWYWDGYVHALNKKLRPESQYPLAWVTKILGLKEWCDPWKDQGTYGWNGYRYPILEDGFLEEIQYRPFSVAINATTMQFYSSGIFDDCPEELPGYDIDHNVLLVGTGNENGVNYWKIKNSFGTSWGENGYMRLKGGNTCGILNWYGISVYL